MSTVADPFWTSRAAGHAERPSLSWPLSLATYPHRKQSLIHFAEEVKPQLEKI